MSPLVRWIISIYAVLVRFYPRPLRDEFEREMQDVFTEAVVEAARCGCGALIQVCLRELWDWPRALLVEHWLAIRDRVVEGAMGEIIEGNDVPGLVPAPGGSFRWVMRKQVLRRSFDIAFAAFWLMVTAPLIAILAVLIVLDSPGPALFRQQRVGKDGRPFTMLKLRSMIPGAATIDVSPQARGGRGDPRTTRVGRVIRALRVDELPQLYNVLKGDMSVFGSRPGLPR
jgi:hypothetical protein